jgi:predicted  nucleic acid-binding Zn-ribbon protein
VIAVATTTNTQTELKRKATARKGQATRLRNQSKHNGSFVESAKTRTKAETNALRAASYEAGRALDASLGAAVSARDSVVDAVRPLGDPQGAISGLRDSAGRTFDRMERRGSATRHRAQREIERLGGRAKREAKERVPA